MLRILLLVAPALLAYLFYNISFFRYADSVFQGRKNKVLIYSITFVINYATFFVVSILGYHLIVNWTIFLIEIIIEIIIIYRCSWIKGLFMSLVCTSVGLSLNIFFRCFIAIVINRPLSVFDNNVSDSQNLKQYPLLLCFILTGFVFWYLKKIGYAENMKRYMEDKIGLKFYTIMLTILYAFLILNLLAYYTEGNSIFTKVWGIKSVVLVIFSIYVGYQYTMRVNQFNQCRRKYAKAQEDLLDKKREDEKISLLAFTDPLTGYFNRQYSEELFESLTEQKGSYVLCFVDLDGLKIVNDRLGHPAGDKYLIKASGIIRKYFCQEEDVLIRYGGDEFLIIHMSLNLQQVKNCIKAAAKEVQEAGTNAKCKYSISYGLAHNNEAENIKKVVDIADQRMYQQKRDK